MNGVKLVHSQQHQLSAIGRADRAQVRRRSSRDVPRELRRQRRADDRARSDDGAVRVRDSARPASRGRSGGPGEPVPRAGRRGACRDIGLYAEGSREAAAEAAARLGRRLNGGDEASADSSVQVHVGDWIVRLDQPYAATPRTLLAIQTVQGRRSAAVRRHRLDARRAASRRDAQDRRLDDPHEADAAADARRARRGHRRRPTRALYSFVISATGARRSCRGRFRRARWR